MDLFLWFDDSGSNARIITAITTGVVNFKCGRCCPTSTLKRLILVGQGGRNFIMFTSERWGRPQPLVCMQMTIINLIHPLNELTKVHLQHKVKNSACKWDSLRGVWSCQRRELSPGDDERVAKSFTNNVKFKEDFRCFSFPIALGEVDEESHRVCCHSGGCWIEFTMFVSGKVCYKWPAFYCVLLRFSATRPPFIKIIKHHHSYSIASDTNY